MKKFIVIFSLLLYSIAGIAQQLLDSATMAEGWKRELAFRQERDSIIQQSIGKPYPAFSAATLDGKVFTNDQLKGKVTFITFWFECCASCISNMDKLKALYAKYRNNPDFQFMSFTYDYVSIAEKAVKDHSIPYPVCPVSFGEAYRLNYDTGFPVSIIVDKNGNMRLHGLSNTANNEFKPDYERYYQLIDQLLAEK